MPEENLSTRSLTVRPTPQIPVRTRKRCIVVNRGAELLARFQPFFVLFAVKRQDTGGCWIQFSHPAEELEGEPAVCNCKDQPRTGTIERFGFCRTLRGQWEGFLGHTTRHYLNCR